MFVGRIFGSLIDTRYSGRWPQAFGLRRSASDGPGQEIIPVLAVSFKDYQTHDRVFAWSRVAQGLQRRGAWCSPDRTDRTDPTDQSDRAAGCSTPGPNAQRRTPD